MIEQQIEMQKVMSELDLSLKEKAIVQEVFTHTQRMEVLVNELRAFGVDAACIEEARDLASQSFESMLRGVAISRTGR